MKKAIVANSNFIQTNTKDKKKPAVNNRKEETRSEGERSATKQ